MKFAKIALLAAGAAVLLSFAAADARPRPPSIVVYKQDNYNGDSRVITEDVENLDWIHFDDRISSVSVRRGVWELCEHAHYRGRCIRVDGDIPKLDRLGFDDKISSIRRIH
jgi:hypothetical protein